MKERFSCLVTTRIYNSRMTTTCKTNRICIRVWKLVNKLWAKYGNWKFRSGWTQLPSQFFYRAFFYLIPFFLGFSSYLVSQISLFGLDPPMSLIRGSIIWLILAWEGQASRHGSPSWPCMSFSFDFWHVVSLLISLFYSFSFGSKIILNKFQDKTM